MAPSEIAQDIKAQVALEFPEGRQDEARDVLELLNSELGARETECSRVLRCVLFLARGDLGRLVDYANRAVPDYRDVIYWAEYDREDQKVRDFNKPFAGPNSD